MPRMIVVAAVCSAASAQPSGQRLTAPDPVDNGDFGRTVALDGGLLVVGEQRDGELGDHAGAAYVFERQDGRWMATAKLLASDGSPGLRFGRTVAVDGDTIAVTGGRLHDSDLPSRLVYIFEREGGAWVELAQIEPNDLTPFNGFGDSLSLEGDLLAIGDPFDDEVETDAGAVSIYRRIGGDWLRQAKLTVALLDDARLGQSVALNGWTVVAGACGYHVNDVARQGAYVFESDGQEWTLSQRLLPDEIDANDYFGFSVAIDAGVVVVGSPYCDVLGSPDGAVFVYTRSGGTWDLHQTFGAANGDEDDEFGFALSIDGDALAVTARGDESGDGWPLAGTAYLFGRSNGTWRKVGELSPDGQTSYDLFGSSAALGGGILAIGAPGEVDAGVGGAAYVYELSVCLADVDGDGDADSDDFFAYLDAFAAGDASVCDLDGDGDCDAGDFFDYLDQFAGGG